MVAGVILIDDIGVVQGVVWAAAVGIIADIKVNSHIALSVIIGHSVPTGISK